MKSRKQLLHNSYKQIKYTWIRFTKEVKNLYSENYKTLMKEIEDKTMEKHLIFIIKMSRLLKAIYNL
jgi:ribosome biogenesis protein Nip4